MVMMNVTKWTVAATAIVVFTAVAVIEAHVALTFPPARKYDLDFLDNSRTKGPCGMPKGNTFAYINYTHYSRFRKYFPGHVTRLHCPFESPYEACTVVST